MMPTFKQRWLMWLCRTFGHKPGSYYYGPVHTFIHCKRCNHLVEDHFG